jgi:beta-galactosidase
VVELPFVNSPNFDVMAHGYKPVGGLFPETSIGWYRKRFLVDKKDSGQRFQIQFDGVFRDANVWLNGIYLGNNKSGYVGFAYDITDYINYDKENVIVVRADASQYEGWFYEGAGIYRHAWLNKYNNIHLANNGTFVYTTVHNNTASINLETPVQNQNFISSNCTVTSTIIDRDGKVLAQTNEQTVSLNSDETRVIKQKISINNPKLWSVDDPYLYRIATTIKSNGKILVAGHAGDGNTSQFALVRLMANT